MPDIRPLLRQLDEANTPVAQQIETIRQMDPDFDLNEEEFARFRAKLKYPLPKSATVTQPKPKSVNIIEALRPFLATGVSIAGNAAGTAVTGNPTIGKVAGAATAAAVDYGMQSLEGKDREESFLSEMSGAEPNSPLSKLASTGQMGLENLVGGAIINKTAQGVKGLYKEITQGGVADPLLAKMGATYSMYGNRPIAEFIENVSNVFHGKKTAAMESINAVAFNMVNTVTSRLTGRLPTSVETRGKLAELINKQVANVFEKSKAESTREGTKAQLIADTLPPARVITGYKQTTSSVLNAAGQPTTSSVPIFDEIQGPIYLKTTLEDAYRIIKEAPKSLSSPDQQKGVLHAAQQLLSQSNAKFNNKGQLVSSTPISFKDSWQFTKELDELAFEGAKDGVVNPLSHVFKSMAGKIRDDVEASIPGWANPANPKTQVAAAEALNAWKASKAIVAQRNEIFDRATKIPKLLSDQVSIVPEIDAIIKDPVQLEKTLRLGDLNLPTSGGAVIVANNLRKDLAGYEFQKIMQEAWRPEDPIKGTLGHFDKNAMISAFMDPQKKDSYKLLFGAQTRANMEQFFDAVSKTAQSGKSLYTSALIARVGYAGITLGTGAVLANLDDPRSLIAGGIIGGTVLLGGIGRAMSNPDIARLLTAAVKGDPLGMSEKAASKFILNVLQGAKMSLTLNDGTERQAVINADGKIKLVD